MTNIVIAKDKSINHNMLNHGEVKMVSTVIFKGDIEKDETNKSKIIEGFKISYTFGVNLLVVSYKGLLEITYIDLVNDFSRKFIMEGYDSENNNNLSIFSDFIPILESDSIDKLNESYQGHCIVSEYDRHARFEELSELDLPEDEDPTYHQECERLFLILLQNYDKK